MSHSLNMDLWVQVLIVFVTAMVIPSLGYLIHRSISNVDDKLKDQGTRQLRIADRLRAVEQNQAIEQTKLDVIHGEVKFLKEEMRAVRHESEANRNSIGAKLTTVESMARKNQEGFGKIIQIMKKLVVKK